MADRVKMVATTQIRHFAQYFLVFFIKRKQELLPINSCFLLIKNTINVGENAQFILCIFHSKLSKFLFGNACITISPFHKKELSDCPVEAIRMAVSFLCSYVDINLKILKCTVK
jgi:hypothetical protein